MKSDFLIKYFQISLKSFLLILTFGWMFTYPIYAQNHQLNDSITESPDFEEEDIEVDLDADLEETGLSSDLFEDEDTWEVDTSFMEEDADIHNTNETSESESTSFIEELMEPARFTVKHEHSYKTKEPTQTINNRSSLRFEYSKFFETYFFLRLDTKVNAFHESDHRSKAEEKNILFESNTKEAYLQSSLENTSVKAGLQVIIWGEADGAAVTDVVAPRDQSELFFISLEESRISQPMLVFDQFSEVGDWTLFYIPSAGYTKMPEKGTQYDLGLLVNFNVEEDEALEKNNHELGLRWKKTFGKSDLAMMVASLIENDYKYEMNASGVLIKTNNRYQILGLTFNYGKGAYLVKGEIAQKSKKVFNNALYELIEKDVIDTAFSVEYSSPGGYTLLLGLIDQRIVDWEDDLEGSDESSGSYMLSCADNYLNEDLNAVFTGSLNYPNDEMIFTWEVDYKYYDHLKFDVAFLKLNITNEKSQLWEYRNEERLTLKIQYQF
jgi:hypothetical protein